MGRGETDATGFRENWQPSFPPVKSTRKAWYKKLFFCVKSIRCKKSRIWPMSANDEALLDYIFNPGLEGVPVQPPGPRPGDLGVGSAKEIDESLLVELRKLELEGIQLVEGVRPVRVAGKLEEVVDDNETSQAQTESALGEDDEAAIHQAIKLFSQAIEQCPEYASAYNNRAQAKVLLGALDSALADLDLAIEHGVGRQDVLRHAYTQRGLVRKRVGGQDEDARRDFEVAARLGSTFARRLAVQLNPYAALCNQMLSQAMESLAQAPKSADAE